jgi:di/tricarboxylate transporter
MGPGGYRFGDYWRLGLPLSIIVLIVGVPLIAFFWSI